MKPSRDAARYRAESDGDDLIGNFNATQRRERFLVSNSYSHHVVVFRSTIMLLESDRVKDKMAAWAKAGSVALPIVNGLATALTASHGLTQALGWIQNADSGLATAAANVPKSQAIEAKLAALEHPTPDLVDEYFAGIVFEVPKTCITSAVLNRGPLTVVPAAVAETVVAATQVSLSLLPVAPALINVGPLKAELIIKYHDPERKPELELWLGTDRTESLDDIATMMREMLGDKFSERAEMWSALRGGFPLRSAQLDWSR